MKNLSKCCVARPLSLCYIEFCNWGLQQSDPDKRAIRRSLNKISLVPAFLLLAWYGLEVGKHKICQPPKHIGEKIEFRVRRFRFSNLV
jgi:hypothetical protein